MAISSPKLEQYPYQFVRNPARFPDGFAQQFPGSGQGLAYLVFPARGRVDVYAVKVQLGSVQQLAHPVVQVFGDAPSFLLFAQG